MEQSIMVLPEIYAPRSGSHVVSYIEPHEMKLVEFVYVGQAAAALARMIYSILVKHHPDTVTWYYNL